MQDSAAHKLVPLQIFRGIAALLVVLLHTSQSSQVKFDYTYLGDIFRLGGAGVDFFFVLSGFIIGYVHLGTVGKRGAATKFLVGRLVRIYPIYWIILVPIIIAYFLVPSFGTGFEQEVSSIVKSFVLWPQRPMILGVAWTLSYEMLFYLVFTLVIWKPRWFTPLVGLWLLGVVARTAGVLGPPDEGTLPDFFLNELVLEFAIGCLTAYLLRHTKIRYSGAILSVGLVAFVLAWGMQLHGVMVNRVTAWGIPSGLVVLGAAVATWPAAHPMVRASAWLGDASYSIYLCHQVVLSAIVKVVVALGVARLTGPFVAVTGSTLLAILTGCLLHAFLEKPVLAKLHRVISPAQARSRGAGAA